MNSEIGKEIESRLTGLSMDKVTEHCPPRIDESGGDRQVRLVAELK